MFTQDFSSLKITTMTLLMGINLPINLDAGFGLLPITRIVLPIQSRSNSKFKIPHYPIPGKILSMRHRGCTRGIVRSEDGHHFKNSITIDLSTSAKNVSLKLSAEKIHMCGAMSADHGVESATILLQVLFQIQDELDYLHLHESEADDILKWIESNRRGNVRYHFNPNCPGCRDYLQTNPPNPNPVADFNAQKWLHTHLQSGTHFDLHCSQCQAFLSTHVHWKCPKCKQAFQFVGIDKNSEMEYRKFSCVGCKKHFKADPHRIWIPERGEFLADRQKFLQGHPHHSDNVEDYEILSTPVPESFDSRLVQFFLQFQAEYYYFNAFYQHCNWARAQTTVVSRDTELTQLNKVMVNYNYDLGFDVDRLALARTINGRDGFYARFNNDVDNMVKVELPYDAEGLCRSVRRKDDKPRHTFMIYQSGRVTQSGPNEELMEIAYYKFQKTIEALALFIMKEQSPRTLTYRAFAEEI